MVASEGVPAVVTAGPKATAPVAATSGLDAAFMGGAVAPGDDDAEVDHLLKLAAEAKKGPAPPAEKPGKAPKSKGLSQLLAEKAQSQGGGPVLRVVSVLTQILKWVTGVRSAEKTVVKVLMDQVGLRRIFESPRLGRWT